MTDYAIRPFSSAAAIRRVGEGLLDCSLPKSAWTHEAHLAACAWLLLERPDVVPERDLPGIIRAYNVAVGRVNDATQGYHETLTQLYIQAVRRFREWSGRRLAGDGPCAVGERYGAARLAADLVFACAAVLGRGAAGVDRTGPRGDLTLRRTGAGLGHIHCTTRSRQNGYFRQYHGSG